MCLFIYTAMERKKRWHFEKVFKIVFPKFYSRTQRDEQKEIGIRQHCLSVFSASSVLR